MFRFKIGDFRWKSSRWYGFTSCDHRLDKYIIDLDVTNQLMESFRQKWYNWINFSFIKFEIEIDRVVSELDIVLAILGLELVVQVWKTTKETEE